MPPARRDDLPPAGARRVENPVKVRRRTGVTLDGRGRGRPTRTPGPVNRAQQPYRTDPRLRLGANGRAGATVDTIRPERNTFEQSMLYGFQPTVLRPPDSTDVESGGNTR